MNPTIRQVRMLNELIWKTSLVNTMKRTVIQITVGGHAKQQRPRVVVAWVQNYCLKLEGTLLSGCVLPPSAHRWDSLAGSA